jgi:hypothetical protein
VVDAGDAIRQFRSLGWCRVVGPFRFQLTSPVVVDASIMFRGQSFDDFHAKVANDGEDVNGIVGDVGGVSVLLKIDMENQTWAETLVVFRR